MPDIQQILVIPEDQKDAKFTSAIKRFIYGQSPQPDPPRKFTVLVPKWDPGSYGKLSEAMFWQAHGARKSHKRLARFWATWHYGLGCVAIALAGFAAFGALGEILGTKSIEAQKDANKAEERNDPDGWEIIVLSLQQRAKRLTEGK